jgi:hypothetical protein
MENRNKNRKPRNRVAIFYKREGQFVGPWNGATVSLKELKQWQKSGVLDIIRNYILKSPLQLRRRVA